MRVYVAGLIADGGRLQPPEVGENCARFNAAAARLRALGHDVVNPLDLHEVHPTQLAEITPELSRTRLERDLEELVTCDAIYLLVGWEGSRGARDERRVAEVNGLLVLEEATDLSRQAATGRHPAWLEWEVTRPPRRHADLTEALEGPP